MRDTTRQQSHERRFAGIINGMVSVQGQQQAMIKRRWSSADELPLEESPLAWHLVCAPEGIGWGAPCPGSQRQGPPRRVTVGSRLHVCKPVGRQDWCPVGGHCQLRQFLGYVRCARALVLGEVVSIAPYCWWGWSGPRLVHSVFLHQFVVALYFYLMI